MPPVSIPVVVGVVEHQPSVLDFAVDEASRQGASLRVVHCYEADPSGTSSTAEGEGTRDEGLAVLQRAQQLVAARDDVDLEVDLVLEHGDPVTVLLNESLGATTVVLGTDDTTWLEQMLGGDVSGPVSLGAACPVVIVPARVSDEQPAGVVVTLDGDTSAAGPLRYGFEQADLRVEDLHVLHATPVATADQDLPGLTERIVEEVARWNVATPDVTARLSLTNGDALEECIRATEGASLLVVGRPHGLSPVYALTRPVAVQVLRRARCPVAIVPTSYAAKLAR